MKKEDAELVVWLYLKTEERLRESLDYVPFTPQNTDTVMPILSGAIVEAGSLIDTTFREDHPTSMQDRDKLQYENNKHLSGFLGRI